MGGLTSSLWYKHDNRMKNRIILLFCCLLTSTVLFGQHAFWEKLPGLPAAFRISETTDGTLWSEEFYSKDNGATWQKIGAELPYYFGSTGKMYKLDSLNGNPASQYLMTSVDQGTSWQEFPVTIGFPLTLNLIELTTGELRVVTRDSINWPGPIPPGSEIQTGYRIFNPVTQTWSDFLTLSCQTNNNPPAIGCTYKLFFSFEKGLICDYHVPFGSALFYNTLTGASKGISSYTPIPDKRTLMTQSGHLLSVNNNRPIFCHDTSGNYDISYYRHFGDTLLNGQVLEVPFINWTQLLDGRIVATTEKRLHISSNEGISWTRVPNSEGLKLMHLHQRADGTLFYEKAGRLYRTNSFGGPLTLIENSIRGGAFETFRVIDSLTWIGAHANGVYTTQNGGIDYWQMPLPTPLATPVLNKMTDSTWLITSNDSLYRFDLKQKSLVNITPPFGFEIITAHYHPNSGNILVGLEALQPGVQNPSRTLISHDLGATWVTIDNTLHLSTCMTTLSGRILGTFRSYLQPQQQETHLKSSDDGGLTWTYLKYAAPQKIVQLKNGDIHNYWSYSIDNGVNWAYFPHYLSPDGDLVENSIGHLWRNFRDTISSSINDGRTWTKHPLQVPFDIRPTGLPDDFVADLQIDAQDRIYISAVNNLQFQNTSSNLKTGIYRSRFSTSKGTYLTGQTYKDGDSNCATIDPVAPLPNWIVTATNTSGKTYRTNTDSLGTYIMFVDTGAYVVTTSVPAQILWVECSDSLQIQLPTLLDTTELDMPAIGLVDCPLLDVDLVIDAIAPCFESPAYLAYHNYGTVVADSAWIDLQLPIELLVKYSLTPYDSLGGGLYRFHPGAVGIGEGGNISMTLKTTCDTLLIGQTLCAEAHIYPDSLCVIPMGWSGAEIGVTASCINDTTVRFYPTNATQISTQTLDYIILEDDVVLRQGTQQYGPGQAVPMDVTAPTAGKLYRFQSNQEPGHPFSQQVMAWVTGCGPGTGNNAALINQFLIDNGIISQDTECPTAVGSYDPNDKRGFPLGVGAQHLIEPNTELEYIIRFQNTGTAAAHFVVIRDTLDLALDPASLRIGASSHPFVWTLTGERSLSFRFDPINLPDSTTDLAGSQGFISFKIKQKRDLPLGTVIKNQAFIYFDYNGAVATNQTTHQLGRDFLTIISDPQPNQPAVQCLVSPNPVGTQTSLQFIGLTDALHRFILTDMSGRTVLTAPIRNGHMAFERQRLLSGLYFYGIFDEQGRRVGQGKLVVR
jgi:hypothetical protein